MVEDIVGFSFLGSILLLFMNVSCYFEGKFWFRFSVYSNFRKGFFVKRINRVIFMGSLYSLVSF